MAVRWILAHDIRRGRCGVLPVNRTMGPVNVETQPGGKAGGVGLHQAIAQRPISAAYAVVECGVIGATWALWECASKLL